MEKLKDAKEILKQILDDWSEYQPTLKTIRDADASTDPHEIFYDRMVANATDIETFLELPHGKT